MFKSTRSIESEWEVGMHRVLRIMMFGQRIISKRHTDPHCMRAFIDAARCNCLHQSITASRDNKKLFAIFHRAANGVTYSFCEFEQRFSRFSAIAAVNGNPIFPGKILPIDRTVLDFLCPKSLRIMKFSNRVSWSFQAIRTDTPQRRNGNHGTHPIFN